MTDHPNQWVRRIVARFGADWSQSIEVGPGWYPLLAELDERLTAIAPGYIVQQVKSKFGSLAFYAQPSENAYDYNEDFQTAIREAEWASTTRCEECGGPAQTYTIRMWVWTLCQRHAREKRSPPP
jgi:hypothetical protein